MNGHNNKNEEETNKNTGEEVIALLLKTAWGGKDLAIDFRPPSSGLGDYYNNKGQRYGRNYYGWEYRRMIKDIYDALSNESLSEIIPEYDPTIGDNYSLEGFIWFQGKKALLQFQHTNLAKPCHVPLTVLFDFKGGMI